MFAPLQKIGLARSSLSSHPSLEIETETPTQPLRVALRERVWYRTTLIERRLQKERPLTPSWYWPVRQSKPTPRNRREALCATAFPVRSYRSTSKGCR